MQCFFKTLLYSHFFCRICHPEEWNNNTVQKFNQDRATVSSKPVLGTCSCDSGAQLCEDNVEKTAPPKLKVFLFRF